MKVDLTALRRGDGRVWKAFVDRYTGLLYTSIQRTLKSYRFAATHDDVLDIIQNVFVRLTANRFHLLKNYDPSRASLSTWLTVVAHSATIDYLRKCPPANPLSMEKVSALSKPPPEPREEIDVPEGLLSPRQHLVLKLFFDYDMDVKEIAEFLDIHPQTVRSTKHKGLVKLREYFGGNRAE
jgi:RNA polymerase sigma-70 factor (ECF subfamily)